MRWLAVLAVLAAVGYFNPGRMETGFAFLFLALAFVGLDIHNQEKKLTAIESHGEQCREELRKGFDALELASAKTLLELASVASRLHSLEVEIELLRKHLLPDTHRPWDA